MRVTICGNIGFHGQASSLKKELEKLGHEVKIWPSQVKDENGQLIPELSYKEEILGVNPTILNGDLTKIA